VVVNVTDPAATGSLSTTVNLGGVYISGDTYALTAASLTTKSGILLGGHFVGKGGRFAGVDHTDLRQRLQPDPEPAPPAARPW
jgi:hypothetical protein